MSKTITYNISTGRIFNGDNLIGSVGNLHSTIIDLFKKYCGENGYSWLGGNDRIIEGKASYGHKKSFLNHIKAIIEAQKNSKNSRNLF